MLHSQVNSQATRIKLEKATVECSSPSHQKRMNSHIVPIVTVINMIGRPILSQDR